MDSRLSISRSIFLVVYCMISNCYPARRNVEPDPFCRSRWAKAASRGSAVRSLGGPADVKARRDEHAGAAKLQAVYRGKAVRSKAK